jgi:DNA repair protein RadC
LNRLSIAARDIFSEAIKLPCAQVVVVHNHPSGNPEPSEADRTFTAMIREAGELLGVTLLDHVIVCKQGFFSFRQRKLL